MARIRTIKPEAFASESLAEVSLTAERTFFGLLTQADDHGRYRDHAAIIRGVLWPLRPEHTALNVEDDLQQLAAAGLICRYTGPDGKAYLHIVSWHTHQKINRPGVPRHPACPHHNSGHEPALSEPSLKAHGGLTEHSAKPRGDIGEPSRVSGENHEPAGQQGFTEGSVRPRGGLTEPSMNPHRLDLGPRILDQGSIPSGGASAPAPDTISAQQLIGEYIATCASRPPSKVLGHLGREINQLLTDGIHPAHIRAGLERFRAKPMHPSVLSSLVNEAMNARPSGPNTRPGFSANVHGHTPWTNPTDPAAYAEEL
ncbi:hypothetical protein [Streptantibioticus ferralitis]|uniref:Phage or prophage related protein n=1 Tax=Streptantibioticus ferralitis TaxID=236510 RepID=A0ABT5Z4H3_9ACTN|nr:hypothetical protein [Streptantibioticus ferralitis]MDF2258609.1 hypothetical protein [Streptantibioticus ferralitis]